MVYSLTLDHGGKVGTWYGVCIRICVIRHEGMISWGGWRGAWRGSTNKR